MPSMKLDLSSFSFVELKRGRNEKDLARLKHQPNLTH